MSIGDSPEVDLPEGETPPAPIGCLVIPWATAWAALTLAVLLQLGVVLNQLLLGKPATLGPLAPLAFVLGILFGIFLGVWLAIATWCGHWSPSRWAAAVPLLAVGCIAYSIYLYVHLFYSTARDWQPSDVDEMLVKFAGSVLFAIAGVSLILLCIIDWVRHPADPQLP